MNLLVFAETKTYTFISKKMRGGLISPGLKRRNKMKTTGNEIEKTHKGIRLVQRKNENWEEFKERIQATIEKLGDK